MVYIYIYTMEYYSATKRNKIGSFVETWMDLETVIQNEVNQKELKKLYINTYMWNLRNGTDEPISRVGMEMQT